MSKPIIVYNYDDYRALLHDWFWTVKEINAKLSFRYVSRSLSLKAPNHFHLVITRKRHLSPGVLDKVLRLMKLESMERQYVKLLFRENLAKSPEAKQELASQRELMRAAPRSQSSDNAGLRVVGHSLAWYIKMGGVVFEGKSRDDLVALVKSTSRFPVTVPEINQAIDILLEARQLEFLDGLSRFEGGSILTKWDVDSADIKRHHQVNLSLATAAIAWPVDQRFLSSVTVPCDEDLYQAIVSDVRALCLSILERSNKQVVTPGDATKVATLQLALFPYFKF